MNVLIIRPGALGDTLMVLPALVDLAGKAVTTFVGRQPGLDYIRDFVYRSIDFEGSGWHRLFMERPEGHCLPVSQTDLLVAFFSEQGERVGQVLKVYFPHVPVHIFRSLPPKGEGTHAAQYIAECLKTSGLRIDPERSMQCAARRALLGDTGVLKTRNTIVFHPGSGDLKKNHPPLFWLQLLGRLCREDNFQRLKPIFLLGPAEEHLYSLFKERLRSIKAEICLCPDKDPLTELLREAALYLGHDSGITHLTAMLGTPTVALVKKSHGAQWRPLGPYVRVTRNKKPGPGLIEEILEVSRSFINLRA